MSHIKDTNIRARDSYSLDAAGRFRTSGPEVIFDSKLIQQTKDVLKWDEELVSGAGISSSTPGATTPYTDITSSLATAGNFVRQTFNRFNFQGGKSTQVVCGGVLELSGVTVTGCIRRIGPFEDNQGFFFQSDAGAIGVGIRLNTTDTITAQASWNLDVMDGTGPSGITADFTNLQDFFFDYSWPGRVRYGLVIEGLIHYVHQVLTLNEATVPSTATPNCPIRYEMITTAASGICVMRCVEAAVNTDGKFDDVGILFYDSSENVPVFCEDEDTNYAIMGIRLKSTALGTRIRILNLTFLLEESSDTIEWYLLFNPTVADTFTYAGITDSAVETAHGATANTVTGGTRILGGYIASGANAQGNATVSIPVRLIQERLGAAIDGTVDEIVVAATPINDSSDVNVQGGMNWLEQV